MKSFIMAAFFFYGVTFSLYAEEEKIIYLSEKFLVEEIYKASPDMEGILGDYAKELVDYRKVLESLRLSLQGSARWIHSNERSLNPSSPITEDARSSMIGLNQPTAYGVDLGLFYLNSKSSNQFFRDDSNSRVTASAVFDLYKNFLGRLKRAEIKEAQFSERSAHLLKKINTDRLVLQFRSLYWNYVAANESYKLSLGLLDSAKKQVADVKKRRRGEIADAGDVARFMSQESERKAQIMQFQAQMKRLEANFRELLPSLQGKKFQLSAYSINTTIAQFYQCLDQLAQEEKTPYQFSLLDDLIALQEQEYQAKQRITAAINRPSISLVSEAGFDGKGLSIARANSSLNHNADEFYSVDLQVDIPLGRALTKSEKAQSELDKRRFQQETLRLRSQMTAFHETLVDAVSLLRDVVINRRENSTHLQTALKDSRKKYKQARITSQQLIDEEDRYLSNQLELIDVEVEIINVMFDYFALFTETPCALNQVDL